MSKILIAINSLRFAKSPITRVSALALAIFVFAFAAASVNRVADANSLALVEISGQITIAGTPLSGVTVTLSGSSNATTTTDASGNYTFTVTVTGNYTVTPTRRNFSFSPTNYTFTNILSDQPGSNFTATRTGYDIVGTVIYGTNSAKVVPNVSLAATGTSSVNATSDNSGVYQLLGLSPNGNYTVTPSKTSTAAEMNGVSSTDAARIQNYLANAQTTPLTANQLIAADVSNNGTVSSTDASRIQQYLVNPATASSNIIYQWKFAPATRTYSNLTADLLAQDFAGILVGEVTGNWTPPAFAPEDEEPFIVSKDTQLFEQQLPMTVKHREPVAIPSALAVTVSLPSNARQTSGNQITIPIAVSQLSGNAPLEGFDIAVTFDPAVLQLVGTGTSTAGTLSAPCSVVSGSPVAGRVNISGACSPPLTAGMGRLVNLVFNVIGANGSTSNLTFASVDFSEGAITTTPVSGAFTAAAPNAATVFAGGRVISTDGRGIRNARMTLTDANGNSRTVLTSQLGYYRFAEVEAGSTYTISVSAKKFAFAQSVQVRTITEDTSDINFNAGD